MKRCVSTTDTKVNLNDVVTKCSSVSIYTQNQSFDNCFAFYLFHIFIRSSMSVDWPNTPEFHDPGHTTLNKVQYSGYSWQVYIFFYKIWSPFMLSAFILLIRVDGVLKGKTLNFWAVLALTLFISVFVSSLTYFVFLFASTFHDLHVSLIIPVDRHTWTLSVFKIKSWNKTNKAQDVSL